MEAAVSDQATFLYQEPALLVLAWPIYGFVAWIFLSLPRRFGLERPTRLMSALLAVWLLILLPFLPVLLLNVVSCVLLAGLLAPIVHLWLLIIPWTRGLGMRVVRFRIRNLEARGFVFAPARMPGQLRARVSQFGTAGFELVVAGVLPSRNKVAILLRARDGTLATVVRPGHRSDPKILVKVLSVVGSEPRAVYETSNSGVRTNEGPALPLLTEVVPYARPDSLLEHHLAGCRLLEARGIAFALPDADDAIRIIGAIERAEMEALLGAIERRLLRIRRITRPVTLTTLLADPAYEPVVAAMLSDGRASLGPGGADPSAGLPAGLRIPAGRGSAGGPPSPARIEVPPPPT
jgi:hypothetical protein